MANPPVVVEFQAQGMAAVQQAFRSVEAAALRAEKAREAASRKAEKQAEQSAKREADAAIKYLDKQAEAARRAADKRAAAETRATEKRLADEKRANDRAAAERERAARREAAAQERFYRSMGGMSEGEFRRRQQTQALMKDLAARRAIAKFEAERAGGAGGGGGKKSFSDAISGKVTDSLGGLATKTGLVLGAFALLEKGVSFVADTLSQFGGFVLSDLMERLDRGKGLQQALNAMGASDRRTEFNAQINKSALDIGVNPDTIMQMFNSAANNFGDPEWAMKIATKAAKFEKSYGGGGADMAAILAKQVKAAGGDLSDDELNMRYAILEERIGQKDATLSSKMLGAKWAQFEGVLGMLGGDATANLMHSTGLATFAGRTMNEKKLFPALEAFISSTQANMNKGNEGPIRQVEDLPSAVAKAIKDADGDERKLKAAGFNDQAIDFLQPFLKVFKGAKGDKGAALDALLAQVAGPGEANLKTTDKMVAAVDETAAAKLERMQLRLKESIERLVPVVENEVIPALQKILPSVEELEDMAIDELADALTMLADHIDSISSVFSVVKFAGNLVSTAFYTLLSPVALLGGGIFKVLAKLAPFMGMKDKAAGWEKTSADLFAIGLKPYKDRLDTPGASDGDESAGDPKTRREKRLQKMAELRLVKGQEEDTEKARIAAEAARRAEQEKAAAGVVSGQSDGKAVDAAATKIANALAGKLAKLEPPSTPLSDPNRKP